MMLKKKEIYAKIRKKRILNTAGFEPAQKLSVCLEESALTNLATEAFKWYWYIFFIKLCFQQDTLFSNLEYPGGCIKAKNMQCYHEEVDKLLIRKKLQFCDDSRFLPTLTT